MPPRIISPEAQLELDTSWTAYVERDFITLKKSFTRMAKELNLQKEWDFLPKSNITLSNCLRSQKYSKIKNISDDLHLEFGLLLGWRSIFSFKYFSNLNWADAYAALLGESYFLDVNIDKIMSRGERLDKEYKKETTEYLEAPYLSQEEREALWPFLDNYSNLSIHSRVLFIRAIRFLHNNMANLQVIIPVSIPFYDKAINELSENGFVDPNPSITSFLMLITMKDLAQFAYDRGIKHTGPKYLLVERIVDQISSSDLEDFVHNRVNGDYIQILVSNLPELKKYI